MQRLNQTFTSHMVVMNELVRQVMVTSVERGVILQRLLNYFQDNFNCMLNMGRFDKVRADDLFRRVTELEQLLRDITTEKLDQQREMLRLLEENGYDDASLRGRLMRTCG
jgi:hypothetical protein